MPNDKFLFVIVDGIYIFESNLIDKIKIYDFIGPQIIDNVEDINKTALSDITYNTNLYVFCLVKDFLYLFDNNKKKIVKELDLRSYLNGKLYSLNPFINATYLSCIISYTKTTSYYVPYKYINVNILNIYEITLLSFNENEQNYLISKREYFNEAYVDYYSASYISKDSSTCEISSNILYCFYFIESSTKIKVSGFDLSNNYEEINCNNIYFEESHRELYEIKSFNPSNSDLMFICYYAKFYNNLGDGYKYNIVLRCIYYNIKDDLMSSFSNSYYVNCNNFQPYYFEENDEFVLGCNNYKKAMKAFLYNGSLEDVNNDYLSPLICTDTYNFLIYYNTTSQKYNLITDCYIKNNDSFILSNLTLFVEYQKNPDDKTNYIIPRMEETETDSEYEGGENSNTLSDYSSHANKDNSNNSDNSDKSNNSSSESSSINSDEIAEQTDIIVLNISKNEIIDNISNILNETETGENYEMNGKDFNLIIKPTNSTFHNDSTHVNFQNCEEILRKNNNISDSTILTFVQLEVDNEEENFLINSVEYEVYDDKKNLLNLSVCNNTDIEVVHLIKDNFNDLSFISSFFDSNIDIFNINDSFYHDNCKAYYNSKHDMVLKDRIIDIYQKFGVCEEGCSYNEFNKEYKTVSCSCKTKTKMANRELSLHVQSYDGMNFRSSSINTDFSIIKCYKIVFSFEGKFKNIGFWIFLILFTSHIPFMLWYLSKGLSTIKEYIFREMTKNRYISLHHISKQEILDNLALKKKVKEFNSKNKAKHGPPVKKKRRRKKIPKTFQRPKIKISEEENLDQVSKGENNGIKSINYNNNVIIIQKKKARRKKKKKKKSNKALEASNMKKNFKNSLNSKFSFEKPLFKKSTNILDSKEKKIKVRNKEIVFNKEYNNFNFLLIYTHLHHPDKYSPIHSKHILNNYNFEESVKYDKRSVCNIFYIFLLYKQAIIYTFFYKSPLELFSIRFCYLLFTISLDFAMNALFYSQYSISKKYRYDKNLIDFTIKYNIIRIIVTTFIGFIFMILFNILANSINNAIDVFRREELKMNKIKGYNVVLKRRKEIVKEIEKIIIIHKIKVYILFFFEFLIMLFFFYYVTDFCHIYPKTQLSWLFDSFLTLLLRLIIMILFSLLFSCLYRISILSNNNCLYKFTRFIYSF